MDDFDENEYQCTLCYEILFYPVLLPCKHSFCKICLDQHVESNSFSCPLCRARLSNWLRQLKNKNLNIVDIKLWKTIQTRFPKQVECRRNGESSSSQTLSDNASSNNLSAAVLSCREVHKEVADSLSKTQEEWRGWPSIFVSSCRDVILQKLNPKQRTTTIQPVLSNPGEINQDFKKEMEALEIEKKKMEEKEFRLSEALIKKIEEEERSEIDQLQKLKEAQLKADEEVAKKILEEEGSSTDQSINGMLKASKTPKRRKFVKKKLESAESSIHICTSVEDSSEMTDETNSSPYKDSDEFESKVFGRSDSPLFLGPANPKSTPNSSRGRKLMFTSSPIPLDKPSTSKDDIFSKYFSIPPENNRKSNSSQKESLQNSPPRPPIVQKLDDAVSSTTISNKELSHFAAVDPGPSTSSGACEKQVQVQSRCSSGADSIGQELHHFKPIRSSPTTPPKEGCEWVPQVVVAQRCTVSSEVAHALSTSDLNLSTEEIEESVQYHKQLEGDLQLALKLQKEWDAEENKKRKVERSDYNLRKRKKSNLRKKVLLDRTQTTLDSMLIK